MNICVNCSSRLDQIYIKVDDYSIYRCKVCLLLQTETRKNDKKKIEALYDFRYLQNHSYSNTRFVKRFSMFLNYIAKYVKTGKFLDIGCGSGNFLNFLNQKSSYKLYGLEPNSYLRDFASNSKINIKSGTLSNAPYKDDFFDIISCIDVLEHSFDVQKNIQEITRILKSKGFLLIQAPNYNSFMQKMTKDQWDWWSPPDHKLHFSFDWLKEKLVQNNYKIISAGTYDDKYDYFRNIKGVYKRNIYSKFIYILLLPFNLIQFFVAPYFKRGALILILAQKQ